MSRLKCRVAIVLSVLAGLVAAVPGANYAEESKSANESAKLLSIGQVAPVVPGFEMWTDKAPGTKLSPGDRVIVHIRSNRKVYAVMVGVSPDGNVTVLFPSREGPNKALMPTKVYKLFDDDSRIRLKVADKVPGTQFVFYLSDKPLDLGPGKKGATSDCLTISAGATKELKSLISKLKAAEKGNSLKRFVVSLSEEDIRNFELQPGKPVVTGSSAPKGVPSGGGSSPPETITGVQGVK